MTTGHSPGVEVGAEKLGPPGLLLPSRRRGPVCTSGQRDTAVPERRHEVAGTMKDRKGAQPCATIFTSPGDVTLRQERSWTCEHRVHLC